MSVKACPSSPLAPLATKAIWSEINRPRRQVRQRNTPKTNKALATEAANYFRITEMSVSKGTGETNTFGDS